jgi:Asp/Glu/hydantoin racemase
MAKVLVLVPYPLPEPQMALRRAQVDAAGVGPGIAFEFRGAKAAPANYVSAHDTLLADLGMFEAGLDAEAEGFDAVCVDTVSDAGVAALRSVLDIPVIGPGRAAMLHALMWGERFAILTMWRAWTPLYTKILREAGLETRCAAIRDIAVAPDSANLLTGKEDAIIPKLIDAGRAAVDEDGADVLILGSTTMHQAHAALTAALPVPVINPGPLAFKLAEAAIALKLRHSRAAHPRPRVDKRALFRAMMAAATKT